jgi:hypothetical protein
MDGYSVADGFWNLIWDLLPPQLAAARGAAADARDGAQGNACVDLLNDHPLMAAELEQLGLPVKVGVPD